MTPLMRMSTRSEIATSVNCVRRTRQCSQVESWVVGEESTRLLSQHVVDCVIPVPAWGMLGTAVVLAVVVGATEQIVVVALRVQSSEVLQMHVSMVVEKSG